MPGPAEDISLRADAVQRDFNDWMAQQKRSTIKDEGAGDDEGLPSPVGATRNDGPVVATPLDGAATADVLYGWLSRARYELSYLGRKLQAIDGVGAGTENQRTQAGQGSLLDKRFVPSPGAQAQHAGRATIDGNVPVLLRTGQIAPGGAADSKDSIATELSLPLLWPERSLRRVANVDGETTVWLRDYRLSAEEIACAVAEILQTQGDLPPVSRIMVNGVEAWRQGLPNKPEKS